MKNEPIVVAAVIAGLCTLGAAYISSGSSGGIRMEGNRSVIHGGNNYAYSSGENATSIITNTVSNNVSNNNVAATGNATVIQNNSNHSGSRIIINGKVIE